MRSAQLIMAVREVWDYFGVKTVEQWRATTALFKANWLSTILHPRR